MYTPELESWYLIIKNVPRLSLANEIKTKFSEYGEVETVFYVDNPDIFSVEEI